MTCLKGSQLAMAVTQGLLFSWGTYGTGSNLRDRILFFWIGSPWANRAGVRVRGCGSGLGIVANRHRTRCCGFSFGLSFKSTRQGGSNFNRTGNIIILLVSLSLHQERGSPERVSQLAKHVPNTRVGSSEKRWPWVDIPYPQ